MARRYHYRQGQRVWSRPFAVLGNLWEALDDRIGAAPIRAGFQILVVKLPELPRGAQYWAPGVARIYQEVWGLWPDLLFLGVPNCRKINDSSLWSYHAWNQALDIGVKDFDWPRGTPEQRRRLLAVYHYLMAHRARLGIIELLGPPDNAAHANHVHAAVKPVRDRSKPPPCAKR